MNVAQFFTLFLEELRQNKALHSYYKFLNNPQSFRFRKQYFCQRLAYVAKHLPPPNNGTQKIWDCGCGYGTTGFFLAMNGIASHGTTVEFYLEQLEHRRKFWNQFGDTSLFTASHENIFHSSRTNQRHDAIILQDTLHHLEPLDQALQLLAGALSANGGKLIVTEENGDNLVQSTKLYAQRGNRRVIEIYDEKLNSKILLGNENIRSAATWQAQAEKHGLRLKQLEYVRFYPPFFCNVFKDDDALVRNEQQLAAYHFLRKYMFFGINFILNK